MRENTLPPMLRLRRFRTTPATLCALWLAFWAVTAARQTALFAAGAGAAEPVPIEITEVAPQRFETRGDTVFADFGKDVYGSLQIEFSAPPASSNVIVRLGEKLAEDGAIDRRPPGSVSYREIPLSIRPGQRSYRLEIPTKRSHQGAAAAKSPAYIGEVAPFRYAEVEGAGLPLDASGLRQLFAHAPFDDNASRFECSDDTLNAVWALCKHTVKAATAFGVYIDGERERIPYEADAYINLLSHYACDLDPRVGRATFLRLMDHPTWPTEWSLHMPMYAAADYRATGDVSLASANYERLKKKLFRDKARGDGLIVATSIVDWPQSERDNYNDGRPAPGDSRQIGPEVNTVANAFYYRALRDMALLARALNKEDDARDFDGAAARVFESFNRVFFDSQRNLYIDGEGSAHASLHANMFALAFGLAPESRIQPVADFVQSRGMACSVYGAQYLLEALFGAGRDGAAVQLMAAGTKRSWRHMIDLGSTMTLEAWDAEFKKNLTWNHAWGTAPANIISRFVLGARPVKPGYSEMLIAPQLGTLQWARGQVPTPLGPVSVNATNGAVFTLELVIPPGSRARVQLPRRASGQMSVDGKPVSATGEGATLAVESIEAGTHVIESR